LYTDSSADERNRDCSRNHKVAARAGKRVRRSAEGLRAKGIGFCAARNIAFVRGFRGTKGRAPNTVIPASEPESQPATQVATQDFLGLSALLCYNDYYVVLVAWFVKLCHNHHASRWLWHNLPILMQRL
jgi:hypothetical protein